MNNFIVNDSSEIREHFNILKRIKTSTDYKQTVNPETNPEIPQLNLSESSKFELEKHFQKMKLKGFSDSTIRSYQSNLTPIFQFF